MNLMRANPKSRLVAYDGHESVYYLEKKIYKGLNSAFAKYGYGLRRRGKAGHTGSFQEEEP